MKGRVPLRELLALAGVLAAAVRCASIAGLQDGQRAPGVGGTGGSGGLSATGGATGTGGSVATGGASAAGGASGGASAAGAGGSAHAGAGGSGLDAAAGAGGSAYAAAVLADHPIAYYRLGESVPPTAFDSSGNGHDATYMTVTVGVPGALKNDPDTAVRLDGTGVINGPNLFGFVGGVPFSVEAWVMPESTNSMAYVGKVKYDQASSTYGGWFVYVQTDRTAFCRNGCLFGPPIAQGVFTHVVATYDTVNATLYLNGQQVATQVMQSSVAQVALPFTIGHIDTWAGFVGVIDEVALYDHALSAARVLAHYKIGAGLP